MKLEEQILEYENDFFKKKFCSNMENLNNRIHDDFIEFGKSGKVFNKDSIIEYLINLDDDRDIEIESFEINIMKKDFLVVNYISDEKEIDKRAVRTSIWINENENWKLYFHQGTITEAKTIR